ncbi:MAG: hypothetical protein Q7O66_17295, partial [Dehalococcoidia bacterium]|nr:hypothetical protein [Dehalococcoidia bacterium]
CADAGYSKKDVKRILWEQGRLPVDWFPDDVADIKRSLGLVFDGMVPLTGSPDDLVIIVAGGPSGLHTTFVPTMGVGHPAITKPITLN